MSRHSLEIPIGYKTKKVLYRSQVKAPGTLSLMAAFHTKNPYRMISVTPQAMRMPAKATGPEVDPATGLPMAFVVETIWGYISSTTQTTNIRDATCMAVVMGLARTRPTIA